MINVAVVGAGAFGQKHLDALANIDDAQVVMVMGRREEQIKAIAEKYGVSRYTTSFDDVIQDAKVDAVIIASPTQLHAGQGIAAMEAGKHVMIEIPMCDSVNDAEALCEAQVRTGKVAMAGHTRRFNPSHQWMHKKIRAGELNIQQMDVQTYFFRRTNTNAKGEPRSWTDHLLWHHACHTVDLFAYQAGEPIVDVQGMQGPKHPELGIAMDMSIGLKTATGKICTLSLSFNNDGPLGTFFRYICDNGTYIARYDDLVDGHENPIDVSKVDVSMNGIELQDREFISAILEEREPNASVHQAKAAMQVLGQIEELMDD